MSGHPEIVEVAAAVITRPDGKFLLARRPDGKPYAGYWEFPGGKAMPDEPLPRTLQRELQEELGIHVESAYPWITRIFSYPHATVRLHFYRITEWHGEPQPRENQALSWQFAPRPKVEPMLPANAPVLRALDLPSVYGITHAAEIGIPLTLERLRTALQKGLRLIQVREKNMAKETLADFARAVVALARPHGARVLVNCDASDAHFYREAGADGIHLSSARLMALKTRPDIEWCGVSCHNAEELFQAEQLEMDFVVLGPVLPTLSHPGCSPLGWRKFAAMIRGCSIPVYALGGLRKDDLAAAWEQGAHGLALMRGIA
ncbi:MAG TPA: Nudix family hydrolase [Nitrosospira sp.]|nr:Nudix family hydrolase [Nitrosospira sp.]